MSVRLEIDRLTYRYPGQDGPALRGVSATADDGQVLFLLGPNGSGKTTLFRTMLTLIKPRHGEVRYDGRDARSMSTRELARVVSYIPQQSADTFDYSVLDTVLMGRTPHLPRVGGTPKPADIALAEQAIATMGIEHLSGRGIAQISGGQRQLVMIARALCQGSQVVVMDEPTASLDFANQHRVLRQARRLAQRGVLVVISSHNPADAMHYADTVMLMRGGELVAHVPTAEVTDRHLSDLYGIDVLVAEVPGTGRRVCLAADEPTIYEGAQP